MFKRHIHKWIEIKRRFTPPITNISTMEGFDRDQIHRVLFGLTTVESKCVHCGQLNFEIVIGDQTSGNDL